jgi:hypothetical protein
MPPEQKAVCFAHQIEDDLLLCSLFSTPNCSPTMLSVCSRLVLVLLQLPSCMPFSIRRKLTARSIVGKFGRTQETATRLSVAVPSFDPEISSFVTCSPSQTSTTTSTSSIHLLSLKCPSDGFELLSKQVKDVWEWKDEMLGDGRDFFVPSQKTLEKLQGVLMKDIKGSTDFAISLDECAILSNCARFEILFVISYENKIQSNDCRAIQDQQLDADETLRICVSNAIMAQVEFHQALSDQQRNNKLDQPEHIQEDEHYSTATSTNNDLQNYWNHIKGTNDICHHLCLVASGMAVYPKWPLRYVEFRPFSSRDAHISWQLKRTLELASGSKVQLILQSALASGKACRNVDKVSEIYYLQAGMGHSKDDVEEAKLAAITKAINPVVRDCVEKLLAADQSTQIQKLHTTAMSWSQNEEDATWLRKELHEPTMALRARQTDQNDGVDNAIQELQQDFREWRNTK